MGCSREEYMVEGTLNGKTAKMFADSGAEISLVKRSFIEDKFLKNKRVVLNHLGTRTKALEAQVQLRIGNLRRRLS